MDTRITCQKIMVLQNLSHNITFTTTKISISAAGKQEMQSAKVCLSWCRSEFELFCNVLSLLSWFILLHTMTSSIHLNRPQNMILYINNSGKICIFFIVYLFTWVQQSIRLCFAHPIDFLWLLVVSFLPEKKWHNPLVLLKIVFWSAIKTRTRVAVMHNTFCNTSGILHYPFRDSNRD